jgi:hypothetical protein
VAIGRVAIGRDRRATLTMAENAGRVTLPLLTERVMASPAGDFGRRHAHRGRDAGRDPRRDYGNDGRAGGDLSRPRAG